MTEPTAVEWADAAWMGHYELERYRSKAEPSNRWLFRLCTRDVSAEVSVVARTGQWRAAARGRLYWLYIGGKPGTHPTPTTKQGKR